MIDPLGLGGSRSGRHTRAINRENYRVEIDISTQVLRLALAGDKVAELLESQRTEEARGGPTPFPGSAVPDDWEIQSVTPPSTLHPTLHAVLRASEHPALISGAMLMLKAKQFDDELYAAVELAEQEGVLDGSGAADFLRTLLGTGSLPPGPMTEVLYGAAALGEVGANPPQEYSDRVARSVQLFLDEPQRSKPLGFYAWSPALRRIFRQDRLLQTVVNGADAAEDLFAVARALHADGGLRERYESRLDFIAQLTNPFSEKIQSLRPLLASFDAGTVPIPDGEYSFLPPSRSHESGMIKEEFQSNLVGINVMDEFINAVRAGNISLAPTAESGWYDYCTWALEPLVRTQVMPESEQLVLAEHYRAHLEGLFKAALALTRETHGKQLECDSTEMGAGIKLTVAPVLVVEPLGSFYARRAITYLFVERVLRERFGEVAFGRLHRATAGGFAKATLCDELEWMRTLFVGAFSLTRRELGLDTTLGEAELRVLAAAGLESCVPDSSGGLADDERRFWGWTQAADDPDLAGDLRMMVPIGQDPENGLLRVWVFLGWREQWLHVSFENTPPIDVFGADGRDARHEVDLRIENAVYSLPSPVVGELTIPASSLLDRDEFRALCDRSAGIEEIYTALGAEVA